MLLLVTVVFLSLPLHCWGGALRDKTKKAHGEGDNCYNG